MKGDRQKVFDKYGGKCAYCGCDLIKGWHVDEIEPVRRNYKRIAGHWSIGYTKGMTEQQMNDAGIFWVGERTVPDGCIHPDRFNINNQNPSCASCNINKHSMDLEQFRNLVSGFINSLNQYSTQYKIAKRYGLISEIDKPILFYFETLEP